MADDLVNALNISVEIVAAVRRQLSVERPRCRRLRSGTSLAPLTISPETLGSREKQTRHEAGTQSHGSDLGVSDRQVTDVIEVSVQL